VNCIEVKPEALEIASLRVNRLGRNKIRHLLDKGVNTVQKLKKISLKELEKYSLKILPRN